MNIILKSYACAALLTLGTAMASHDDNFNESMTFIRNQKQKSVPWPQLDDAAWLKGEFSFLQGQNAENICTFFMEASLYQHAQSDITMHSLLGGNNSNYAKHVLNKARSNGLAKDVLPLAWHGGNSQLWVLNQDFNVVLYAKVGTLEKDHREEERSFGKWLWNVYLGNEHGENSTSSDDESE